jgi:putative MATE family efflux protein
LADTITRSRRVVGFFADKEYYVRLVRFALPIALQQLIMASLNLVGVVMIGQLGAAPVAAIGLANQVFFLLNLLIFSITSGSSIFIAQLWGRRDIANIRKVLGLSLTLGLSAATLFLLLAELIPVQVLSIYSEDPVVVSLGSDYLRILGFSFLPYAVTFCFSAVLRSTGDVRTPLFVTLTALSLNTLLSYLLIFGKLGLPALGVLGAGYAVIASRIVECSVLLWLAYRKKSPAGGRLSEIFSYDLAFARRVLKPVLPVVANEMLWSTGITAYYVVYARIGTDAIAAMNITASIDNLAFVLFIGVGNACAILVGHLIGEGDEEKAFRYAGRSLVIGALGGVVIGAIILVSRSSVLTLYNVEPIVINNAYRVLTITSLCLWLRAINMILFIGVLRSGGDTRFALLLDGVVIWVLGVPLALLGAFALHLPVYWVYLLVMSEELTKAVLGIFRYFSRKWIHNVAQTVET